MKRPRVHARSRYYPGPLCSYRCNPNLDRALLVLLTDTIEDVTCTDCRRALGLVPRRAHPWARRQA